jgi:hypothetical protein
LRQRVRAACEIYLGRKPILRGPTGCAGASSRRRGCVGASGCQAAGG